MSEPEPCTMLMGYRGPYVPYDGPLVAIRPHDWYLSAGPAHLRSVGIAYNAERTCLTCGGTFGYLIGDHRSERKKYCGPRCAVRASHTRHRSKST